MSMIEQFVSRYYTDDDLKDWEQENQIIQENLARAKKCMTNQLWEKLYAGWFHDAYIMQLHCNDVNSLYISVRKHDEVVNLIFPSVSLFECFGPLLHQGASFPTCDCGKPMAQILDIWAECTDEVTLFILLDNARYFKIRCSASQRITCRRWRNCG